MPPWTTQNIPSLAGTLSVVTGANSGIGLQTALELAKAGSAVILGVRTDTKGWEAEGLIRAVVPGAQVRHEVLDLASLKSVRDFAEKVNSEGKLDVLVNNAGIMAVPERRTTEDGFELQLGTNYLGAFALTLRLLPVLRRAEAPRVTTVSSGAADGGLRRIRFEDLQWKTSYGPWKAYCQSKLADLLFMLELGRRAEEKGERLVSTGAHPGYARTPLLTKGSSRGLGLFFSAAAWVYSQDAASGALPVLRAATEADAVSGSYFGPDGLWGLKGKPVPVEIPKPALDLEAARRLWDISEQLTATRWPRRL